jgi:hypothetical protein
VENEIYVPPALGFSSLTPHATPMHGVYRVYVRGVVRAVDLLFRLFASSSALSPSSVFPFLLSNETHIEPREKLDEENYGRAHTT